MIYVPRETVYSGQTRGYSFLYISPNDKQQSKPLFKIVVFCIHPVNDTDKANMQIGKVNLET